MRKFYIENEQGERLSLVDVNNLWFNLPSGLGIGMHNAYSQVKQGFYSLVESSEEQAEITGVLVFRAEKTEQSFIEITDKLFKSKELNLVYIPYGDKEYYRQICITSIQKSEKRMNRFLECPVIFTALTPWADRYSHHFIFTTGETEDGKRYDYRYDYRYIPSFLPNSVDFKIQGHYPADLQLTIKGAMSNPVLTLLKGAEIIGRLDLTGVDVASDEYLIFSTKANNPGVWISKDGVMTDIIDLVNLSEYTTFFQIPNNEQVRAEIIADGINDTWATLNVNQYYKVR
jgi:hypothetical protein